MKPAPSFDDIAGCRVESVELFQDSFRFHLSKGSRSFWLSSMGDIDAGDEVLSTDFLSDRAATTLRDVVGTMIESIYRGETGVIVNFEQGRFIRMKPSPKEDYSVSYTELLEDGPGSTALE